MAKQISDEVGLAALKAGLAVLNGEIPAQTCTSREWKTAVRWGLQELARLAPGRAVEVRVPPAGAVQILGGTVHRRGTPPAVVEMSMETFVALAAGKYTWQEILEGDTNPKRKIIGSSGKPLQVEASGERAEIGHLFPLL
ncbi:sterol carrier family protein [Gleimia sp. 6138-11-ORH1]|uniref:sterol carrier family protein n=1 Tax=Gleimia sp. 6138-11-ORH1 TaxID=2973937 RepID=UPI00216964C9|nr:sterol carrier family protein [Gleimia sp. 6138-11-ORH1]MCS4485006.1 sterol carrier family protein [Gleimia sp. 6138-11-ORH1]